MNEEKYYVRWRGKLSGPFDADALVAQVKAGQLTRHHVLSSDQISWTPAASVLWLFEPQGPQPVSDDMEIFMASRSDKPPSLDKSNGSSNSALEPNPPKSDPQIQKSSSIKGQDSLFQKYGFKGAVILCIALLAACVGVGSFVYIKKISEESKRRTDAVKNRQNADEAAQLKFIEQNVSTSVNSQRGRIIGNCWATLGDGTTQVRSGLKIYLCNTTVKKGEVDSELRQIESELLTQINIMQEAENSLGKPASGNAFIPPGTEPLPVEPISNEAMYREKHKKIINLQSLGSQSNISLEELLNIILIKGTRPGIWSTLISKALNRDCFSDIHGHYELNDVPPGKYYIYSLFSKVDDEIEWFLPVDLSSKDVKLDLFNANSMAHR